MSDGTTDGMICATDDRTCAISGIYDQAEQIWTDDSSTIAESRGAFEYQAAGNHYQKFSIQPAEFIIKNDIPGAEASIIRYVCRHADKNGIEDLRKACQYLEMLAEIKYGEKL